MLVPCPNCEAPVTTHGSQAASCPSCGARFQLANHIRADVITVPTPEPSETQSPPTQSIVFVGGSAPSYRRSTIRKRSSPWGRIFAILISLVIAASSIASTLLMRSVILARNEKPPVQVVEQPRPTSQPTRRPILRPTATKTHADGKMPVPTDEQLEQTRQGLSIHGELSASDYLDAAENEKNPRMRYLLLTDGIEKAVKEGNVRIALRGAESVIEQYALADPLAFRQDIQDRLRAVAVPVTPVETTQTPVVVGRAQQSGGIQAIELPPRSNTEPIVVANVAGDSVAVTILQPAGNPAQFSVTAVPEESKWSVGDGTNEVASFVRHDNSVKFTWANGASDRSECLRNSLLKVEHGAIANLVALRTTATISTPPIELSKQQVTIPFETRLWGLAPKSLYIEALEFNNAETAGLLPSSGRAQLGDSVRMAMRADSPSAGIEVSLGGSESPILRLEPKFVDFDGKEHEWTHNRVKGVAATLNKLTNAQAKELPLVQAYAPKAAANLRAHVLRYGDNPIDRIASERAALVAEVNGAQARLAFLTEAVPVNRQRLVAFKELQELMGSVDKVATVTFRIFYIVDGHEIDLVIAQ